MVVDVYIEELAASYKLRFAYNKDAVERVKTIPGRQFRKDLGNAWLIPKTSQRAFERFVEWASGKEALKEIQRPYVDPQNIYPASSKGEKPWQHQLAAFRYLWNRRASLLDLKAGSGKSRIFVDYCLNRPDVRRILVLCPKSFVQGWRAQFEKHGGSPVVCACLDNTAGTVDQRVQAGLQALEEAHQRNLVGVVVVNYDVCWRAEGMADFLLDAHFDVLGLDEIQRCRGAQTKVSRFAYRLGASIPVRIGLSGTPFPETPLDSFGVCRALDASVFGTSFHRYRARFAVMGGYENHKVLSYINQNELQAKIDTVRFTVEPEGYELPPEQDIVIPLLLPPKVQKLYETLETDLYAKIGTGEVRLANAAVAFTRLQAVCSGVVPIDNLDTSERTLTPLHTLKADALRDLLDSLPSQQCVVVICRFHYDLAQIHKIAEELGRESAEISGRPGHPKAHIDGGVWFGPETVLAVQAQSGVEGLDLTRAHVMCYYSYSLELGKYTQSRARIRRAGQTEPCTYYHLVVQGAIDQKIRVLLEKKQHVLQRLLIEGGVSN